ncbi:MAG: site-specific integrase, partial [Devosia sp.]
MNRITKRTVDAIEAGSRDQYLWDGGLGGFGLKVTPAGRKVFLVQYRLGGRAGRTRRVTLGPLGKLTPEQAREDAKSILREVAAGRDPAAERERRKAELSLGDMLDRFLAEHVKTKLRARTDEEYRRLVRLNVPPALRNRPIGEIGRTDIARLHHEMAGKPYQANRTLALLSKAFNWSEKTGLRLAGENPCRHIDKYRENKRERFLSPRELAALGEALSGSTVDIYAVAAVRLLLFTGARLSEILTLKWAWVDMDRGVIRLPDSKTGAKTIYLNAPALSVLSKLPRGADNPFVICGSKPRAHLVNLQKPWRAVRASAGLPDVRIHDLRHTFASVGAGGGASLPMIGALLGHSQPQTTDRYAHLAADPLRAASDAIARQIDAALTHDER